MNGINPIAMILSNIFSFAMEKVENTASAVIKPVNVSKKVLFLLFSDKCRKSFAFKTRAR